MHTSNGMFKNKFAKFVESCELVLDSAAGVEYNEPIEKSIQVYSTFLSPLLMKRSMEGEHCGNSFANQGWGFYCLALNAFAVWAKEQNAVRI
jgi:hypothetical protein